MRQSLTIALSLTLLAAGSASAQLSADSAPERRDPRGLSVGLQLVAAAHPDRYGRDDVTPAGGGALTLDYRLNERVSVFARGTSLYGMGQVDVGARYRFRAPESRLRPYVEAAVSRMGTSFPGPSARLTPDPAADGDVRASGTGATLGVGMEYRLRDRLSLDVGVSHTFGRFTGGEVTSMEGATERVDVRGAFNRPKLSVGLRWSF